MPRNSREASDERGEGVKGGGMERGTNGVDYPTVKREREREDERKREGRRGEHERKDERRRKGRRRARGSELTLRVLVRSRSERDGSAIRMI